MAAVAVAEQGGRTGPLGVRPSAPADCAARMSCAGSSTSGRHRRASCSSQPRRREAPEVAYPLHVRVCERCLLVQLPPLITPEETFTEYAYFSSFSTSWVEHAAHVRRRTRCSGWGWARTRSWSRWRATTATCCSTSSSGGSGAWASSRR